MYFSVYLYFGYALFIKTTCTHIHKKWTERKRANGWEMKKLRRRKNIKCTHTRMNEQTSEHMSAPAHTFKRNCTHIVTAYSDNYEYMSVWVWMDSVIVQYYWLNACAKKINKIQTKIIPCSLYVCWVYVEWAKTATTTTTTTGTTSKRECNIQLNWLLLFVQVCVLFAVNDNTQRSEVKWRQKKNVHSKTIERPCCTIHTHIDGYA